MFQLSEEFRQSGCIYLERLRLVNDIPVFYDLNYLPNINLPRFCNRRFEDQSSIRYPAQGISDRGEKRGTAYTCYSG